MAPASQLLLAVLLATSSAAALAPVPVRIGGQEDLDACPSLGQVGGARSGMISVRSAPAADAPEIDRLANGAFAYVCENRGEWVGVVYLQGEDTPDCGVGSPVDKRMPYPGPCKSGWVRSKWIRIVAG